jgi:TPR repeat protein
MAQLAMGFRHMHGANVPKNCQAAVEFYKPAVHVVVHDVEQFRPPPMTERYTLAQEGSKPRPEDLDEDVVDYYQYSAARGDPAAQVPRVSFVADVYMYRENIYIYRIYVCIYISRIYVCIYI